MLADFPDLFKEHDSYIKVNLENILRRIPCQVKQLLSALSILYAVAENSLYDR